MGSSAPVNVLYMLEAAAGGAKRHVLQLLAHLDRRRFQPSLLCSTRRDPRFEDEIEGLRARGIEVSVVPMQREIHPLADLQAYRAILDHLRAHHYDIVHTHCAKAGFLGRRAACRAKVPGIVHTPHLLPFQATTGLPRALYLALERRAARWADRIIVLTEGQKRQALDARLCDEAKLAVIPNGISTWSHDREVERKRKRESLGIAAGEPLAGTIGRLSPQKGLSHFLEAAKLIAERHPRCRFLIVGEGPLEGELRRLATRLGIAERCLWIPHQAKIEAVYCALDVFVLPSLWEGLPYTLLESMAAGCPIVATSIAGPADVFADGESALLVPPADAPTLAEKVMWVIDSPVEAKAMAAKAMGIVRERYTLEGFVRRTEQVYESVLATPGSDAHYG